MKLSPEVYCQYLLSSQVNYTCTNLADHFAGLSHDAVHRFLRDEKLTPRLLWEKVSPLLVQSSSAYLIFDDTVLDKRYSTAIEGVRRQYSGNEHGLVRGIGLVNCVYYDPINERFWVIDYRVFDPEIDGKSKLSHVLDMLSSLKYRGVLFQTVLMDSWYATQKLMAQIDQIEVMKYLIREAKVFYCPIKVNRKVDASGGKQAYQQVQSLEWNEQELEKGKSVKLHKFPLDTYMKLFRVEVSTHRTEYLVTNDMSQDATQAAKQESSLRWSIEQLHREEKQLTGIEKSQCRLARAQRNHICAAMLVWTHLKAIAYTFQQTVYQLKKDLMKEYLIAQLAKPSIKYV